MNRWKNYVWMAASASALGIVGAFTAKPLFAQIRAALVQNVDEPGRTPYMSLASLTGCQTSIICEAQFTPIPSGKRLVATNITGVVDLDTPGVLDLSCVDFVSNTVPYCFPTTLQTGVFAGLNHIGINAAIGLFIDGPDQPVLGLVGTTRIFGPFSHVALSGYLVDCSSPGSCASIIR